MALKAQPKFRPDSNMPSAKEIAEAKAAARKKDPKFSIDWNDVDAVRALVAKHRK